MEITVGCHCGSKYTFEEETVNGRVRWPVTCPNCGGDGTNQANEYIQRMLSGDLEREQKQNTPWWRRFFSGKKAAAASGESAEENAGFRFGFGVVGAAVGAVVGFAAWYLIRNSLHYEFGLVAWGIGGLVGFCARFAARGGSFGLAGIASLAAAAAILGGQYWSLHQRVDQNIRSASGFLYEEMHVFAEKATRAETDGQLAMLLQQHNFRPADVAPGENPALCAKRLMPIMGLVFKQVMKDGTGTSLRELIDEKRNRPKVTPEDVAAFRKAELPAWREFFNDKPSEAEFTDTVVAMTGKNLSFSHMMMQSWTMYTFLWIFLGVGTAWRLAYDKWETE